MTKPPIIALCGEIGAGKSTVAQELEKFGYVRLSLALPLKRMLSAINVPWKSLHGTSEEKANPLAQFGGRSGRELMQTLGTEWGRAQHPDFWLLQWRADVARYDHVVVDDMRFQNEFDFIRGLGGVVAAVNRNVRTALVGIDGHASEQDWRRQRFDLAFDNFGTKDHLVAEVRSVMRNVFGVRIEADSIA